MPIKKGDKIKVEYEGTLDDGTVFDSTEKHGKPLEFEVGAGQVIKGFDEAVIGMEKGEEKTVKIEPKDAYGEHNPELVKKVPKEVIKSDVEIKPGMFLIMTAPDGRQFPALVKEITDKEIVLDLNHPLAGKTLNFRIKIIDIL